MILELQSNVYSISTYGKPAKPSAPVGIVGVKSPDTSIDVSWTLQEDAIVYDLYYYSNNT